MISDKSLFLKGFVFNEYTVLKHSLGSGSFGKVMCAERKCGMEKKRFAVKRYDSHGLKELCLNHTSRRYETRRDRMNTEIFVLSKLFHRNIVLLFEVIDDPDANVVLLVTEFVEGGASMVYNSRALRYERRVERGPRIFDDDMAKNLFCDLIHALCYLKKRRCCHGDIHPENVLVSTDGKALLCDFGEADAVRETATGTLSPLRVSAGHEGFMAPEKLNVGPFGYNGFDADTYAAGAVLYVFLCGFLPDVNRRRVAIRSPFDRMNDREGLRVVRTEEKGSSRASLLSLLETALEFDREKRLRDPCLVATHPWVAATYKKRTGSRSGSIEAERG